MSQSEAEMERDIFNMLVSVFEVESIPVSIQSITEVLQKVESRMLHERVGSTESDIREFLLRQPNCSVRGNLVILNSSKIPGMETEACGFRYEDDDGEYPASDYEGSDSEEESDGQNEDATWRQGFVPTAAGVQRATASKALIQRNRDKFTVKDGPVNWRTKHLQTSEGCKVRPNLGLPGQLSQSSASIHTEDSLVSLASSWATNEFNSVSSSGEVKMLCSHYGVLKTDSDEEVYFNRRDCLLLLPDANLKEYFHKGQRLYFDLYRSPERAKYKWTACRVTTAAPATPAVSEAPTGDESSAVIELELLKYLVIDTLECQPRAVSSASPKSERLLPRSGGFPRSLPVSSVLLQKFSPFFLLKDEQLTLKQALNDSSWTHGKATVTFIGSSSALAVNPDGDLVYFIRSALYLQNKVVAKGKLGSVLVVGDVLDYIAVPYQMPGSTPTIEGAADAKFQAVLVWQCVFDGSLSRGTQNTTINVKRSEDSPTSGDVPKSQGTLRPQGVYRSEDTHTSEVLVPPKTNTKNKDCSTDHHLMVKSTKGCQTYSTGEIVMTSCIGNRPVIIL